MLKHLMNREDWSEKNVAQKGFTLIELLVVIAILGILAVVGVLAFGGFTDSAHKAVNKTELAEVKTAVAAFKADNDLAAPTSAGDLDTYIDGTSTALTCTYGTGATFVAPTYGQTC